MINSITIKNFQSHQNSTLEFVPGVNVIVGATDSGKSAIIRAFRFVFWNRPTGDSFRSWWGGKTRVEVDLPKHTIQRVKTNTESYYQIDDGEHFNALKTEVPDKIQKLLKVTDINLQRQLDQPFLLSETSGKVASHFNNIARLGEIDTGRQNVEKWIRETNHLISYKSEDLKTNEEKLETYNFLEKAEIDLEVLELLEKERNRHSKDIKELTSIIERLGTVRQTIRTEFTILEAEPEVDAILTLKYKREQLEIEQGSLYSIISKLERIIKFQKENEVLPIFEEDVNTLLELITREKQFQADFNALNSLVLKYTTIVKKAVEIALELAEKEKILTSLQICPFCGTKLNKNGKNT